MLENWTLDAIGEKSNSTTPSWEVPCNVTTNPERVWAWMVVDYTIVFLSVSYVVATLTVTAALARRRRQAAHFQAGGLAGISTINPNCQHRSHSAPPIARLSAGDLESEYEKIPEAYKTPQLIEGPSMHRRTSTTSVENADIMIRILFSNQGSNSLPADVNDLTASDRQRRCRIKKVGSRIKRKLSFKMGSITEDLAATASAVPQPRPSGRKLSIAPLPTANPESRVRQVPPVERRRRSSLALNLAQRPPIQGASANPPRIPTLINLADRVRSHSDDALRNRPFTADPACGGERPFMFPSRRRVGISFSSENNASSNLTRPRNKSSSELESVSHV